jgi:hypothetical protein
MLDNTVWRQYHKENNFKEILAKCTLIDVVDMIEDDKELYGVLKAKLTKKELKLLAMDSANIDDKKLKSEFSYDDETLQKAKFKLYKKLKQDKTRLSFRPVV